MASRTQRAQCNQYKFRPLVSPFLAEAAAPSLSRLSHGQLLGGDLEPASWHSPHQRGCAMRKPGSLEASAPGARVPGPRASRGARLRAERQPPPAARGCCGRRRAPGTSAGSFLSELQSQCTPGLQHPLCPPPATTFSSPGGLRCSPVGPQRDSGCREEGGARERQLPRCASSFLGAERAALSSRLSSGLQS